VEPITIRYPSGHDVAAVSDIETLLDHFDNPQFIRLIRQL